MFIYNTGKRRSPTGCGGCAVVILVTRNLSLVPAVVRDTRLTSATWSRPRRQATSDNAWRRSLATAQRPALARPPAPRASRPAIGCVSFAGGTIRCSLMSPYLRNRRLSRLSAAYLHKLNDATMPPNNHPIALRSRK